MALIKSTRQNSAFRSEDISYICKFINQETNRIAKELIIGFKSGREIRLCCKTVKETNEMLYIITEAMQADYK